MPDEDTPEVVEQTQPEPIKEPTPKPKVETPEVKDDPTKKESPSPMAERFANKLKAELGDRYNEKLDKMPIEQRIDTMELLLEALGSEDVLIKGEGKVPLNAQPNIPKKAETILQKQRNGKFNMKHQKHSETMKRFYT